MSAPRNSLAQRILAIGAQQRLSASMENADALDQETLDEVARKAAESMPGEADTSSEEVPADPEAGAIEPTAPADDEAVDVDVDAAPPVDETQTATDADTEVDPTAEQIETPTEQVVDDLSETGAEESAEVATAAIDEAGEATADPIPEATGDVGDTAPSAVDVDAVAPVGEEAVAEVDAPAADVAEGQAVETPESETPPEETTAVAEPPVTEVTAEEPQAEEAPQQAAEAPSASQDSEAALNVANLLEAVASSRNAHDVVEKARQTSDSLTDLGETVSAINDGGGVSMETYAILIHAVGHYENMLGRSLLNNVSLESFADKPRTVNLESIADAIRDLEGNLPVMERQAVESLDRIRDGVLDALPQIRARLHDVISQAALINTAGGHDLQLEAGLASALSIDGAVPENVGEALIAYSDLGSRILGRYSETAFRSAREASMLNNAVDFSSLSAFWERMGPKIQAVRDPRHELTTDHLVKSLPGGARLFDNSPALSAPEGSDAVAAMVRFVTENVPMEASVQLASESTGTTKALSCSMVVHIAQRLLEVLDECKIKAVFAEGAKLWPEAQDSVRFLRETFRDGPDDIVSDPSGHLQQVIKFVETAYSLTTWPIVNYLANAVITANAFVTLATESMKPQEAPVADPGVIQEDAVVDEAPPVEAPVVEVPAEEPAPEVVPEVVQDDAAVAEQGEGDGLDDEPEPSETASDDLEGEEADPDLDDFEGEASDLDEDEEQIKL